MGYNWLYTSWSDNEYILFLIIIILFLIIINFGLWKKKDSFFNITTPFTTAGNTATTAGNTATTAGNTATTAGNTATTASNTATTASNTVTTAGNTATTTTKLDINSMFVSPEEKEKWGKMWSQLDGNDETIPYNLNTSNTAALPDSITQLNSTLYNNGNPSNVSVTDYSKPGAWASVDNLGKSLTDSIGGINSDLGYTVIGEQLGTFKPNYNNSNVYDNTLNYNGGSNPNNLMGVSTSGTGSSYQQIGKGGQPIFLQKDFAGVANIFAPNIYIASDKAFGDDGFPNLSYTT